jgi:DNA-binding Lrp family transcriptional regulator
VVGKYEQGEMKLVDRKTATKLRQEYPTYVPVNIAAPMLGVSGRQLSRLVAEGRQPFADIGVNIGIRQRYVRIYTERLIAYLSGEPAYD